MIEKGILNPSILSLLARVRHTNMLVIADRGFPFWPQIETVDISLVDGVPTVGQVLKAIKGSFKIGEIFQAQEFYKANTPEVRKTFLKNLEGYPLKKLPHVTFKTKVPSAIGLIRTADTIPYANLILVSA